MSKYTTEVRFLCESLSGLKYEDPFDGEGGGLVPAHSIDEIILVAAPKIFSFDFPIFDETYRILLEQKILRHYYTREICEETYGLWKLRLEDRMALIMPYYNELYKSALIEFNPLYDVDVHTERDVDDVGSTTSQRNRSDARQSENVVTRNEESTAQDSAWDLRSDTPQGQISSLPGIVNSKSTTQEGTVVTESYVGSGYLSEAKHANDVRQAEIADRETGNETSHAAVSETAGSAVQNFQQYTDHVFGKRGTGTYSAMLTAFRETFLRIDQMLVDELKDLFFNLW